MENRRRFRDARLYGSGRGLHFSGDLTEIDGMLAEDGLGSFIMIVDRLGRLGCFGHFGSEQRRGCGLFGGRLFGYGRGLMLRHREGRRKRGSGGIGRLLGEDARGRGRGRCGIRGRLVFGGCGGLREQTLFRLADRIERGVGGRAGGGSRFEARRMQRFADRGLEFRILGNQRLVAVTPVGRSDGRHAGHCDAVTLAGCDTVGNAGVGFDAAQQLHAGIQEVVDLTLVIPALALALGEHGIGHRFGGDFVVSLDVFLGDAVDAEFRGALVDDLIGQLVDLLAVVGRHVRLAGAETLADGTSDMTGDVMVQILGLRLPGDATMLGDLACGLLVDHGTLQTGQRGVDLRDDITAAGQIEGDVLNIALRQLHTILVVQRVRMFQKLIHLIGIITPLALPGPGD